MFLLPYRGRAHGPNDYISLAVVRQGQWLCLPYRGPPKREKDRAEHSTTQYNMLPIHPPVMYNGLPHPTSVQPMAMAAQPHHILKTRGNGLVFAQRKLCPLHVIPDPQVRYPPDCASALKVRKTVVQRVPILKHVTKTCPYLTPTTMVATGRHNPMCRQISACSGCPQSPLSASRAVE